MISGEQYVVLNQGNPWEGGYQDFIDHGTDRNDVAAQTDCFQDIPTGLGPATFPDTAAAFSSNTVYSANAKLYGTTNSSYSVVIVNTNGSIVPDTRDTEPIGYLGWLNMPRYNPYDCSLLCSKLNNTQTSGCDSYNIYYLRSPVIAPGIFCPAPASMTNIICGFYGNWTNFWNMANTGETRYSFQVVIAGNDSTGSLYP